MQGFLNMISSLIDLIFNNIPSLKQFKISEFKIIGLKGVDNCSKS